GVALRVEAADEGAVAGRVAAFAGAEGDARHQAQGVLQAGGAGLLQQALGNDRDRLGRVHQVGGELGRGRVEPAAAHVDAVQVGRGRFRVGIGRGGGLRRHGEHGQRGAGQDRGAGQGGGGTWDRVLAGLDVGHRWILGDRGWQDAHGGGGTRNGAVRTGWRPLPESGREAGGACRGAAGRGGRRLQEPGRGAGAAGRGVTGGAGAGRAGSGLLGRRAAPRWPVPRPAGGREPGRGRRYGTGPGRGGGGRLRQGGRLSAG